MANNDSALAFERMGHTSQALATRLDAATDLLNEQLPPFPLRAEVTALAALPVAYGLGAAVAYSGPQKAKTAAGVGLGVGVASYVGGVVFRKNAAMREGLLSVTRSVGSGSAALLGYMMTSDYLAAKASAPAPAAAAAPAAPAAAAA
jgi:hypothetical protein